MRLLIAPLFALSFFLNPLKAQETDTALAAYYLRLGDTMIMKANLDSAFILGEKATDIYLAANDYDSLNYKVARGIWSMSTVLRHQAKFDEAIQQLKIARRICEAIDSSKTYIGTMTLNDLGICYFRKGDLKKALEFHQTALEVRKATFGDENKLVAESLGNMGNINFRIGNFGEAEKLFNQTLKIQLKALGFEAYPTGQTYLNLGNIANQTGFFHKALAKYDTALTIIKKTKGENHFAVGYVYANMGSVYTLVHDYQNSINHLKNGLQIVTKSFGGSHPFLVSLNTEMGMIYNTLGDFENGLKHLNKAEEIQNTPRGNYPGFESALLDAFGDLYMNKKDYSKALEYYKKSVASVDLNSSEAIIPLHKTGNALVELKEYSDAVKTFNQALRTGKKHYGELGTKVAHSNYYLGNVYLKTEQLDSSEIGFKKALKAVNYGVEISNEQDFVLAFSALRKLGSLNLKKGKISKDNTYLDQAKDYFSQADQVMDKILVFYGEDASRRDFLGREFLLFESMIELSQTYIPPSEKQNKTAFEFSEKSKNYLLRKAFENERLKKTANVSAEFLEKEADLKDLITFYEKKTVEEGQKEKPNDSLIQVFSKNLFTQKEKYNALISTVEKEYPGYYELKYNDVVSGVEEVQNALSPDELFLEFFVGDTNIYTFLITKTNFQIHQTKKDFPLENQVRDLRHGLYEYFLSNDQNDSLYNALNKLYVKNAFALYQKLIAALGELPEKLIIVPDGILGYIPFEALLTETPANPNEFKTHSYFGKKHQISYNFSATLWKEMREKKAKGKGLLAFAPVFLGESDLAEDLPTYRRNNLGALIFNVPEVRQINQTVGGEVFEGTDATSQNFTQFASEYSILHLATHAKLDDRNSDYSFLAFSGISDSTNAGKIFIRDLYNMNLSAEMVVLSACETGIGELQKGEGIISLARGFTYAGAKSIITSLWEVNDKSASEIMPYFYENLKEGGSKQSALHKAKMKYLGNQKEHIDAHPFHWAPFIAIGDMSPVSFSSFPWNWLIFGVVILGLFWVFKRQRNT